MKSAASAVPTPPERCSAATATPPMPAMGTTRPPNHWPIGMTRERATISPPRRATRISGRSGSSSSIRASRGVAGGADEKAYSPSSR